MHLTMMTRRVERTMRTYAYVSPRAGALAAVIAMSAGCARFVWHEDPFTPDEAPVTEVVTSGTDTTYVVRGASYYLLARHRAALWNRDVMDDVVWRYRAVFGEAPPVIAVLVDSTAARADSGATWRGVPLAVVSVRRRGEERAGRDGQPRRITREAPIDSVELLRLTSSMLAARAADTWLRARTREVARGTDGQPGGPAVARGRDAVRLPAWYEAAVLATLRASGALLRANAEVRADPKHVVPLATLFAIERPARPATTAIVDAMDEPTADLDEGGELRGDRRFRASAARMGAGAGEPLFVAQSVSVLSFLHERDSTIVARLADDLARGRSASDMLATSATLPHDIPTLDAEWRAWVRRSARRR